MTTLINCAWNWFNLYLRHNLSCRMLCVQFTHGFISFAVLSLPLLYIYQNNFCFPVRKKTHPISSEIVFLITFTEGSTNIWTERSFIILPILTTLAPEALHLQFCSIHRAHPEGYSGGLKWNSLLPTRKSLLAVVGARSGLLCHCTLGIELK